MLLAACVPTVQRAGSPLATFEGPRFEVAAQRFVSFDGAELGLSAWLPPDGQQPWAVVIGLHGMNDYAETFYLAGPWWAKEGIATYAYDARGQGRSPDRGVWGGTRPRIHTIMGGILISSLFMIGVGSAQTPVLLGVTLVPLAWMLAVSLAERPEQVAAGTGGFTTCL